MSELLRLSFALGASVSGSDKAFSSTFESLLLEGYDVYIGSNPQKATSADLVVFSSAVKKTDSELSVSCNKALERFEFLGLLSNLFPKTLAVSGTHGKTTVTGMLANVFLKEKSSFTAHLGGKSLNFEGGLIINGDNLFITEACEFRKSFLSLSPFTNLILNIEYDHPDCYPTVSDLYQTFSKLANKTKKGGFLILGEKVKEKIDILSYEHMNVCEYGNTFIMTNYKNFDSGCSFRLESDWGNIDLEMPIKGYHNAYNGAMTAFTALTEKISHNSIAEGLKTFKGISRRLEYLGDFKGGKIICDYAHHPTEIKYAIDAVKGEGKLNVIFEPHTFSRTAGLFKEFVEALSCAERLFLLPTYAARETASEGKTAFELFKEISAKEKYYCDNYDICIDLLKKTVKEKEILLVLGAGKISDLAYQLAKK